MKHFCQYLFHATLVFSFCTTALAQTFVLDPLTSFGTRGDGSVQPGDSIGINPQSANNVLISAPGIGAQTGDLAGSTNGFNMRGLAYDPVTANVVLVDTHSGSAGSASMVPNAAIYILDGSTGQIKTSLPNGGVLNTNGISGGAYTHLAVAIADDGAVYVCNQVNVSTNASTPFKIYRWASVNSIDPPTEAFSGSLSPAQRYAESIDIRGNGATTQIIIGSMPGTTATNVVIFTTSDGLTFTNNVLGWVTNSVMPITAPNFNDGIAFGTGDTFWAKRVGAPLVKMSFDLVAKTMTAVAAYNATNMPGVANLGPIAVDNANGLLAAIELTGGTVTSGPERVWLFDISNASRPPAALSYRNYSSENSYQNATAPLGYLDFGGGRLYANNVNNGMLASIVSASTTPLPIFIKDLLATNRVATGQTAHFEVSAYPNITGYQWFLGPNPISGATNFFLDIANVQTNLSGNVYSVIASNSAGSTQSASSVLSVVDPADLFHLSLMWSYAAGVTNYFTNPAGAGVPDNRSLAYNSVSNQLIVVRRAGTVVGVFVVDPDTGAYQYNMLTNGIVQNANINIPLLGVGVGDDGAVYACNEVNAGAANIPHFRIYRWADSGTNTTNQVIWTGNPVGNVSTVGLRWGDVMHVRGSGANTQIILDNQENALLRYIAIIQPSSADLSQPWTAKGFLLQNDKGGATIGRSLQFGVGDTFWQKRYAVAGAPLVKSSFTYNDPDPAVASVVLSGTGLPLFTNAAVGINLQLNLAAAIEFNAPLNAAGTSPDTVTLYDVSSPETPVVLNRYNFPVNHINNANAIAQVVFGVNPINGTNYVFALNANNGIMGLTLSSGPVPPPVILSQPKNQRVLQGTAFSISVVLDSKANVQWQQDSGSGFSNLTSGTNTTYTVNNSVTADSGSYRLIASNNAGSVTSAVATVIVSLPADNYTLSQTWTAVPATHSYLSADGGPNTPKERSIAFNSISNQLIVLRDPVNGNPALGTPEIHVIDAATGLELYTMSIEGIFRGSESELAGSNPLDLTQIVATEDGNIYACNEVPNGGGGVVSPSESKKFRVYRWTNSSPSTLPVQIFAGDPAGQTTLNLRWGDIMSVRGTGTNTELLLDEQVLGAYAGILKPIDETLNVFTNVPIYTTTGGGTIGRSIQFQTATATNFWQKKKGGALFLTRYDAATGAGTQIAKYDNYSLTLGGVAIDATRNLAIGVDYIGNSTSQADALALYEISDPATPMLLARYPFPTLPQVPNVNFICSTIISGNRVFSLDANNGLIAMTIVDPVNAVPPTLQISRNGNNVTISWTGSGFILDATSSLTSPIQWIPITSGVETSITQDASTGIRFYRLRK